MQNRRRSYANESFRGPSHFLQTLDKKLQEHPQIGAIILDGLVLACGRLTEVISKVEEQLRDKVDEIRGDGMSRRERDVDEARNQQPH